MTPKRDRLRPTTPSWRQSLYDIIFGAESPAGRWFDILLLVAILASIGIVALETVPEWKDAPWLVPAELFLTGLFTVEYFLRLICVRRPLRYILSFWGIVDLLSFLPTYMTVFLGGNSRSFVILRSIRLLRVFRVLKLWRMMSEADELSAAVWRAREKIIVFLCVVLVAVTISGTLMYHVEAIGADDANRKSQFTSIPQAMYWATVSLTTVGYGDVVPQTALGKMISTVLILLGYSLIIVPSTFVSAEYVKPRVDDESATDTKRDPPTDACVDCGCDGHRADASYCYRCGRKRR